MDTTRARKWTQPHALSVQMCSATMRSLQCAVGYCPVKYAYALLAYKCAKKPRGQGQHATQDKPPIWLGLSYRGIPKRVGGPSGFRKSTKEGCPRKRRAQFLQRMLAHGTTQLGVDMQHVGCSDDTHTCCKHANQHCKRENRTRRVSCTARQAR